ncbi:sigma-70 family RNA polymerase sigma factor [Alkalicoccobacillus murimartini]|uniref:RNA polymerase sigma factor (Sigma-70 family) n=1 Tax=Alkalicoccobacillus murimartini TaxID=171685 RepID=A0ABT9YHW9_9BACI|nr:sigma-70 family RNA polymerase sigma factor [Alkalicoccobacillus murimartini]MDQ0207453.1 RNA polymerase sigma factor (sigma-70 family) [Alkalicoccobacillus murimartini]
MKHPKQRSYRDFPAYQTYVNTYGEALKHPVIKAFLEEEHHEEQLAKSISNPTEKNIEVVNESFRAFYMELRLVKYLSQLIHFYSIDVSKRYRRHFSRHSYVMDQPLSYDNSLHLHDVLESTEPSTETLVTETSKSLEDLIEHPLLYEQFLSLSDKQKQVLNLQFIQGLSHKVIAEKLGSTPQNISQIGSRALAKLRESIHQGGNND